MTHKPLTREVQRHLDWHVQTLATGPTAGTVRCECGARLGPYTCHPDAIELHLDHLDDVLTPARPRPLRP